MQNDNMNRPQQRNEEQAVDIKQLIYIFLSHWYLFAICVLVALVVGFLINRYSTNVYQTAGTVLIKEDRSNFDATSIMTNMSFGNYQNVDNEIAILKSYSLTDRVVRKMDLEVTYMEKGRIAATEMYKTAPFTVEFDRSVPQAVGLVYEVALGNENITLHGTSEYLTRYDYILSQVTESHASKIDITDECKQGEWIDNGYNRIRIVLNDNYKPDVDDSRNHSFWLNSYPSLVKGMSSFSVSPTSKQSSVVSVVMNGTNKQKIVDFTNTLMNEYVSRGLEKKNMVSENTIEFIDSELTGIQASLSKSESELKDFRTRNDLMNLDMQANQVYTNLRALEKERAEMAVNLKIYKRMQDYIKVQIDDPENLASPSTMGINDPLLNQLARDLVTLSQTKATQLLSQTEQLKPLNDQKDFRSVTKLSFL